MDNLVDDKYGILSGWRKDGLIDNYWDKCFFIFVLGGILKGK